MPASFYLSMMLDNRCGCQRRWLLQTSGCYPSISRRLDIDSVLRNLSQNTNLLRNARFRKVRRRDLRVEGLDIGLLRGTVLGADIVRPRTAFQSSRRSTSGLPRPWRQLPNLRRRDHPPELVARALRDVADRPHRLGVVADADGERAILRQDVTGFMPGTEAVGG